MHLLIVGGTGFLGKRIASLALEAGHDITVAGRSQTGRGLPNSVRYVQWDTHGPIPVNEAYDAVVNLAGANLFGRRWTKRYKALVRRSRVDLTRRLVQRLGEMAPAPKVLVNASAVGYYGLPAATRLDETSPPGTDFLAEVCKGWEDEAATYAVGERRVVRLRFGILIGHGGGALGRLVPIFKMGAGGTIGAGRQPFPWVSVEDAARIVLRAAVNGHMAGAYNVVAPTEDDNRAFTKALGAALRRPTLVPVPPFVLRLLYGEGAKVLTDGRYVRPARLEEEGYAWFAPDLSRALSAEFGG